MSAFNLASGSSFEVHFTIVVVACKNRPLLEICTSQASKHLLQRKFQKPVWSLWFWRVSPPEQGRWSGILHDIAHATVPHLLPRNKQTQVCHMTVRAKGYKHQHNYCSIPCRKRFITYLAWIVNIVLHRDIVLVYTCAGDIQISLTTSILLQVEQIELQTTHT